MIDLDKIDISNFLPHRPPFLFLDKILILNDEEVSTSFLIKEDNLFVENNHFNEMGLVENAAQTCSSIVGKSYFDDEDTEGKGAKLIGFISAIKKITAFSCPQVGSTIISNAKLTSRFDTESYSVCSLECHIFEESTLLLICELNLIIKDLK
ncbi:ABC transporter permease [Cellulophaga sp. E16_2]|uniref:ABC transporter permease n=1 Tax=unclassified Cellulophaga TaxID=2634405 RepID=UPI0013FD1016|nr:MULTISPECIES: ABC transporter permease [unclassified Cellulophaga]MBO0591050.1 ABC transporter permease [Cellulophaga sp. E16_2]